MLKSNSHESIQKVKRALAVRSAIFIATICFFASVLMIRLTFSMFPPFFLEGTVLVEPIFPESGLLRLKIFLCAVMVAYIISNIYNRMTLRQLENIIDKKSSEGKAFAESLSVILKGVVFPVSGVEACQFLDSLSTLHARNPNLIKNITISSNVKRDGKIITIESMGTEITLNERGGIANESAPHYELNCGFLLAQVIVDLAQKSQSR